MIKSYSFQSLPASDSLPKSHAQLVRFLGHTPVKPIVVVIDQFKQKTVDIDGDHIPDISHGALVTRFLQHWLPGYEIRKLQGHPSLKAMKKSLKKIIAWLDEGQPIKAMNLSISYDFGVSELAKQVQLPITMENVHQWTGPIMQWLSELPQQLPLFKQQYKQYTAEKYAVMEKPRSEQTPGWEERYNQLVEACDLLQSKKLLAKDVYPIVKDLETISKRGVKMYVAAGPWRDVNLFGIVPNARNVGILDPTGERYFEDHSLVQHYAVGEFPLRAARHNGVLKGYKTKGEARLQFPLSKLSDKKLGQPLKNHLAPVPLLLEIRTWLKQHDHCENVPDKFKEVVFPVGLLHQTNPELAPLLDSNLYAALGATSEYPIFYSVDEQGCLNPLYVYT